MRKFAIHFVELSILAKRKKLTLHRTAAGLICRKDGRIVKQAFSLGEMESYLNKQEKS